MSKSLLFFLISALIGVNSLFSQDYVAPVADSTQPPKIGDVLPNLSFTNSEGQTLRTAELINGKETILVFYRGGWCPYCTAQMSGLAKLARRITESGFQIIGISGESLENISGFQTEKKLPYRLVHDEGIALAKALKLAYKVDPQTINKYKGYGINIPNGILPVPTVLLVDKNLRIQYVYSNTDYTERLSEDTLMQVLSARQQARDK